MLSGRSSPAEYQATEPGGVVTLAQETGWSVLITLEMWLIFGPVVVRIVQKVVVKAEQGSAHVRKTSRSAILAP